MWLLRIIPIYILLLILSSLQGCASRACLQPLPECLEDKLQVPGFHNIRGWGDDHSPILKKSLADSLKQAKAAYSGKCPQVFSGLTLSGGGQDGAFAAGFLCGWTKKGNRPKFALVTGISTGSLIAPFAFLGPEYDDRMRELNTTIKEKDVFKKHGKLSTLFSSLSIGTIHSFSDNRPLAKLIECAIDEEILNKVATEHLKGRRLWIGTSQMDAERLVIWDMGAIALQRTPEALALFRKVLLTSATTPVWFPPQMFEVEAEGKIYSEMHCDGGLQAQMILFENALAPESICETGPNAKKHHLDELYIIRNLKVDPEWKCIEPTIGNISIRAVNALTKSQGIGDLFRLYTYALRDKIKYNLVFIPKEFTMKPKSEIDQKYMNALFELGCEMGQSPEPWLHCPPLYHP